MPNNDKQWAPSYGLLLAIVTIAFVALLVDLYPAILWAGVLALMFFPLFRRIRKKLNGRDNFAAACVSMLVLLLVVVPVIWMAVAIGEQAADLVTDVKDGNIDLSPYFDWFAQWTPSIASLGSIGIDVEQLKSFVSKSMETGGEGVASTAVNLGQGAMRFLLLLALTMYLLFFFLRDGESIVGLIRRALPDSWPHKDYFAGELETITKATFKGIFVIGFVQGALGAIIFAALGISNAMLWGLAMAVASLVPAVGTALVWLPASVVLAAGGHPVKAIILIVCGVVVIGLADNLLRPRLVSNETQIPDYIVLLTTIGGLSLFGLSGVVIGPLVAGLFLASWRLQLREA
jgi:predicted PurR-regulated permease PerM